MLHILDSILRTGSLTDLKISTEGSTYIETTIVAHNAHIDAAFSPHIPKMCSMCESVCAVQGVAPSVFQQKKFKNG